MQTINNRMTATQVADLFSLAVQLQVKAEESDDRDTAILAYSIQNACSNLTESRREFWAADATINNLELKITDMAEQLTNAAPVVPEALLSAMEEVLRISDRDHEAWNKAKIGIASCRAAMLQAGNSTATPDCWCRTCRPVTMSDMRFVVCPDCGNKRCPHANDHRNDCTGSNEPGQTGSAYPAAPQQEVKS
ncbi:hypothetical protein [Citrobacter braakii]|uniref:hypothetical protein n=1 Tax=Citrobacter braakii TaxID=57706 RepID=UPI0034E3CA6B